MTIVTFISIIAMFLSLLGNFLMAKKNIRVFPVWITANILWIVVNFIGTFNTAMVVMYCTYILIQLYSWRAWKKS